ncbi:hypothetical protein CVT26_010780 [Gymnopilus dilepis]|uniref:Exonuclease domain-containing protein n=1 Tax=Gymnopilus dilepis TaxID=231916 RepID=A0A409VIC4_9AGAR|nr:hypothetical protein CVT26_010780 [Gymnopilus dilepis]
MPVTVVPRPASGAQATSSRTSANTTSLRYLLVLDFEATCWESGTRTNQEIIEFPTLLYNIQERKVEATFHKYVKPVQDPTLSEFCTQLTGITQETVDAADTFPVVWNSFIEFLDQHGVLREPSSFSFLCCGDWDIKTMLPVQLDYEASKGNNLQRLPSILTERWINVKNPFKKQYRLGQGKGMKGMLNHLKLRLEGRHHSGIDDCKNIARIVQKLQASGWEIIEFPTLLYDINKKEVKATFHRYVRPVRSPKLSQFCTSLTGIEQDTVDAAETFPSVWKGFQAFLKQQGVFNDPSSSAFLCCGDWDTKVMLPSQLAYESSSNKDSEQLEPLPVPLADRWINIKKVVRKSHNLRNAKGMMGMLRLLEITHEGRHHSGIDDCRNILKIVQKVQSDGWRPSSQDLVWSGRD